MAYILKNNIKPYGSTLKNIWIKDIETKYVIGGNNLLYYDTLEYIIYDIPSISFMYPDKITPAKGGVIEPTILLYELSWRRVGYSGNKYEQEKIRESANISYYIISGEGASVDEYGKVTWESRGITFDENEREAIVLMTVIINGKENYTTATVKQAKNIIEKTDYGIPAGKSLTVLDIPASGGIIESGETSGEIKLLRTDTYSSEEEHAYEITPEEITNEYYSEAVKAENLNTTIKERSKVGTLIYYYECNGVTGECSADVYLKTNIVTLIDTDINTFSYDDISAGATSALPNSDLVPKFYFSSGEHTTTIPSEDYGEFTQSIVYILEEQLNGFDTCDLSTGELSAASRGTDYNTEYRVSANVTKLLTYSWNPTEDKYGNFVEYQASLLATCKQKPNLIVTLTLINIDSGSITGPEDNYPAKGGSKNIDNKTEATCGCLVTFSSTSTSTEYSNWADLDISYTWSSNKDYVSITANGASCEVTMDTRSTVYNAENRTASITRSVTFTASLKEEYTDAPSVSQNGSCNVIITLDPNKISSISITVSPGSISTTDTYSAKETTKLIDNVESATATGLLTFDSEESVIADNTYGSWEGPTYDWKSDLDYATLTSANEESLNVTMEGRGTTTGEERSATITRTASFKYTLKEEYGDSSLSNNKSCTVTISLEANEKTLSSISISKYLPDNTWLPTDSWNTIPAGGHYLGVLGTYHYDYTSTATSTSSEGNIKTGLVFTDTMAEAWVNGGIHVLSRGTSYVTESRSGVVHWVYGDLVSNELSYTQNKNVITSVVVTSNPGTITKKDAKVEGQELKLSATAASANAKLIFSSNSYINTPYNKEDYGTWKFNGYTGISSDDTIATIDNVFYNEVIISVSNNKSTSERSVTITRKELGFVFTLSDTYNNGATSGESVGTLCSCVINQPKGELKYSSYVGTLTSDKYTLGAGKDSAEITFGNVFRYYRWNLEASSSNYDGTLLYDGNVYVTCSESSDYLSEGTGDYINSTDTSTCKLEKSSYGYNIISKEKANLYLRIGSTEGSVIKTITIKTTANKETKVIDSTSWNNPVVSFSNNLLSASGGTIKVGATLSGTRYYHHTYTSGSEDAENTHWETVYNYTFTFSITNNGNNRFTLVDTTISHSNMTTYDTTDTVTVLAVGADEKFGSASKSVTNYKTFVDLYINTYQYSSLSWEAGSTKSPFLSMYAIYSWSSRVPNTRSLVSGGSKVYSLNDTSYFSINRELGTVTTLSDNMSNYLRTATATVSVSMTIGGITKTATALTTVIQEAFEYKITVTINPGSTSSTIYFYFADVGGVEGACRASTLYAVDLSGGNVSILIPNGNSIDITGASCIGFNITNPLMLYVRQYNPDTGEVGTMGFFDWEPAKDIEVSLWPITGL